MRHFAVISACISFLVVPLFFVGCKNKINSNSVQPIQSNTLQSASTSSSTSSYANEPDFECPTGGVVVVISSVAFVRTDPKIELSQEKMNLSELSESMYQAGFPRSYYFFGQNLICKQDFKEDKCVEVLLKDNTEGYISKANLWLEPKLDKLEAKLGMSIKEVATVKLKPTDDSLAVLELSKGEVVPVYGKLQFNGSWWIKAGFSRNDFGNENEYDSFGYIKQEDVQLLSKGTLNESNLSLGEIPKNNRYARILNDEELKKLGINGFFVEKTAPEIKLSIDDMVDLYANEKQVFITTDLFLHCFHLIFDRMLQDIEEKKLFATMKSILLAITKETENKINDKDYSKSEQISSALTYNLFYLAVANKLLDSAYPIPSKVSKEADNVVNQILNPTSELPHWEDGSKIVIDKEDYSQYKVRGHYERSETLKSYFRAMMWLGRRPFLVSNNSRTLSAIMLTKTINDSGQMQELKKIDVFLNYIVGKTDDYSVWDYLKLNKEMFGSEYPDKNKLLQINDITLKTFAEKALQLLPKQKIISMQTGDESHKERQKLTSGFKLLGQRYTPDAYIFNQLTSPNVGSEINPRNLPSALDVMNILGSEAADVEQKAQQILMKWDNFIPQIQKMNKEIQPEIKQQGNFYSNWMFLLKSLYEKTPSKQFFAISKLWQYKLLNSGLGSWTELKHDTILYSKQSYAEQGDGGGGFEIPGYIPPAPKGYIEPNPKFFSAIQKISNEMTQNNMVKEFMAEGYTQKWTSFSKIADTARIITEKEVKGDELSRQDYQKIQKLNEGFSSYLLFPEETGDVIDNEYKQMALIADVATDAREGKVLEVAIGAPMKITVIAKDNYGGIRPTMGYIYSYYEFTDGKRWSDSEWKPLVYSNETNELNDKQPKWYQKLLQ